MSIRVIDVPRLERGADPEAAPGEVLPALWDHARRRLSQEGRSVVQLVSFHPPGEGHEHRVPRTGAWSLSR